MEMTGWGRYPRFEAALVEPSSMAEAARLQEGLTGFVARGNGRAYGDAAIGTVSCLSALGLDRFCAFDPVNGRVSVEAGVLLSDIVKALLPHGYFPTVVPGTKLVSVGGMIAADVPRARITMAPAASANISRAFPWRYPMAALSPVRPAKTLSFSRRRSAAWTLTGAILNATFCLSRVETGLVRQQTLVAPDLLSALELLSKHDDATYSAAWIDCLAKGRALGRSLIHLGEHASRSDVETLAPGSPPVPSEARRALPCRGICPASRSTAGASRPSMKSIFEEGRLRPADPFSAASTRFSFRSMRSAIGTGSTAPTASCSINASCRPNTPRRRWARFSSASRRAATPPSWPC